MRRTLVLLLLLCLPATLLANTLQGKWNVQSMGSKSGWITFNRNATYTLTLTFARGNIRQEGKYTLKGNLLTLKPIKSLVREKMETMPEDVPPIVLKLTWHGSNRIMGVADREGRKITKMEFRR